jgi:hypothetical protein
MNFSQLDPKLGWEDIMSRLMLLTSTLLALQLAPHAAQSAAMGGPSGSC